MRELKIITIFTMCLYLSCGCNFSMLRQSSYSKGRDVAYSKCFSCHHPNDDILEGKSFKTMHREYENKVLGKELEKIFLFSDIRDTAHNNITLKKKEIEYILSYLDYLEDSH